MQSGIETKETKSEATFSTFVSSVPNKKLHLLLDVDDTVLVKNDENDEFIYNEELIGLLKQWKINEVILFTRMNADRVAYDSKIRIPLIQKLKENDISVIKVITPSDVLYNKMSSDSYQTGDTYLKFMQPVEQSLLKVKEVKITRDIFKQYDDIFHIKNCKINGLQFILNAGLVKADDIVPTDKAQVNLLTEKLETHFKLYKISSSTVDDTLSGIIPKSLLSIINGYAEENIDISFTLNHLSMYFLEEARIQKNITFNQVLAKWQQENNQPKPKILDKQSQALEEFLAARQHYRNTDCLMALAYEGSKGLELTKGSVYQLWIEENPLSAESIVLFIDDSKSEHKLVETSHETNHYQHSLVSLYPPYSGSSEFKKHTNSNFIEPEILFSEVMNKVFILPILDKYKLSSGGRKLSSHVVELYRKGVKSYKEKNYIQALRYFEISYLISSFDNIPIEKRDVLITVIRQTRKDCNNMKNTQKILNDEIIMLDLIYQDIKNIPGGAMHLKCLELDLNLFRKENEFLFKKSLFVFSDPKEINHEFQNNIIKKIEWIAVTFPESADNCITFLTRLKNQFYYDIYKNHIQLKIDGLDQLRSIDEATLARQKLI